MDIRLLEALGAITAFTGLLWWYFFGPRVGTIARAGAAGVQELDVVVHGGYSPNLLVVQHGRPVRIRFNRRESADCSERVVFADFGVSKKLPAFDITPIEFTPDKAGEFVFTCGMGMYQGRLIVREPDHD